jgi:N-acetylglucosaminyl-diphospho-decaprenol L-rhamnosyltransferase
VSPLLSIMSPLLSIVIFSRDDADHLRRCLDTLRDRPPEASWEVIVVDNASTDATGSVVASVADLLPLTSLRLETDTSFSAGNNLGLRRARGEAVLFLNPDTLPEGAVINRCLSVLRSAPRLGLVSPRLRYPDDSHQPTGWHLPTPRQLLAEHLGGVDREVPADPTGLTRVGWLMGCFLMGRRAVLEELGGFDEDFWFDGTDLELCSRVNARGLEVVRVEDTALVHVGHRSWNAARRQACHEALVRWLRRDHGPVQARAVAAAAALVEGWRR